MQISSLELWDAIEIDLINFKNRKDLDEVLLQRFESLINHFNGNMGKSLQFKTVEEIKLLTSALEGSSFYKIRQIEKKDIEKLKTLSENLSLLEKVLIQERKEFKEEIRILKERYPNVDNDKSLKIFDKVK